MKSWKASWKPQKTVRVGFIKRTFRSSQFWERFAITVSALALIVSLAATVATWTQVGVMQDQLSAAERNRAYQSLLEEVAAVCRLFEQPRYGPLQFYHHIAMSDEERRPPRAYVVRTDFQKWSDENQAAFNSEYAAATAKLKTSLLVAKLWTPSERLDGLRDIEFILDVVFSSGIDNFGGDDPADGYLSAALRCKDEMATDVSGWMRGEEIDSLKYVRLQWVPIFDKAPSQAELSKFFPDHLRKR